MFIIVCCNAVVLKKTSNKPLEIVNFRPYANKGPELGQSKIKVKFFCRNNKVEMRSSKLEAYFMKIFSKFYTFRSSLIERVFLLQILS